MPDLGPSGAVARRGGGDELGQQFGERGVRGRLNESSFRLVCGWSDEEGGVPPTEQGSQKRICGNRWEMGQGGRGGEFRSAVWPLALGLLDRIDNSDFRSPQKRV